LETELKLKFTSREEILKLWNAEWFVDILIPNSEKTEYYDTKYFETKDRALLAHMASIRVREIRDGDFVHTVKIGGKSRDGLHQRFEWNLETTEDEFDVDTFSQHAISDGDPSEILEEVLKSISGKELYMICRTSFERTLSLAGFGDSLLEICFDDGSLFAKNAQEDLCELEIELKQGDVRDVLALGEEIIAQTGAVRDDRGKYARCLALLDI
jgi:triphosphatase